MRPRTYRPGSRTFEAACPSCGTERRHALFYEQAEVPVHSCVLVPDAETARAFPRGRIELGFCEACGFIWNRAFDAARMDYAAEYEETQGFSPRFRAFQTELVERLLERHDLRGKRILEIGCGKGEFLVELCERGGNEGLGVDPSYRPERMRGRGKARVEVRRELYTERHAGLEADFVACRHTLEHIPDPGRFVRLVRRNAARRPGTVIFFEVPDVGRVLDETAFWDIYHEHCSYFDEASLARLFLGAGFELLDRWKAYGDQYLMLEARVGDEPPACGAIDAAAGTSREHLERFCARLDARLDGLRVQLDEAVRAGRRVVLWGSGSKAVSYLTTLEVTGEVAGVVDINPHKHGKYLAGTGHEIVSPERLRDLGCDLVVAMNPLYTDEITADLRRLGVTAEVVAL